MSTYSRDDAEGSLAFAVLTEEMSITRMLVQAESRALNYSADI